MKKKHTVIILPKDFRKTIYDRPNDCPLSRAIRRTLNLDFVSVAIFTIKGKNNNSTKIHEFTVEDGFTSDDFEFVKAIKEPYPITIIEGNPYR